jgi:YEATS domain-containing protein 4
MTNDASSNSNSSRLLNTTTCLPIAYGSIAFYLGKNNISNPTATHRWTLYVRSPDPSYDLSQSISKVIFQLHPSFPQPTRELTQPPFEVTEMGWGEFEASIRIVWKDEAEERPVLLTHGIKLYPNNAPATSVDPSTYMNTTVPVVSERYDEVVFTNPKVVFHKLLLDGGGAPHHHQQQQQQKKKKKKLTYPLSHESSVIEHFRTYGDETDVKAMLAAKEFLQKELRSVKDRLIKVDVELEEVKGMLSATMAASTTTTTATTGTIDGVGIEEDGVTSSSSSSAPTVVTTVVAASAGKVGTSSSSKSSKKKKTVAGGGSGEPASKKAKSS